MADSDGVGRRRKKLFKHMLVRHLRTAFQALNLRTATFLTAALSPGPERIGREG